ncbi:MAG: CapA family protein [Longimicrobiaceae bacterium]
MRRYLIAVVLLLSGCGDRTPAAPLTGRVIDLEGRPVAGASVSTPPGSTATTDSLGEFRLPATRGAQWVIAEHPRFISRTRGAEPGRPVVIRLTPDDGETIALHFVGDVMFGRRFFDPNEDGNIVDGLLRPGADAEDHVRLLRQIQPLLSNAHVSVVNLESPLHPEPFFDPTGPRPAHFHSTKDYVFASEPSAAVALQKAGVTVVGLANNHLYDALEEGVAATLQGLERAGFRSDSTYFGAGHSAEQAWRPAFLTIRGQRIAFLGCTSITGDEHPISYVATETKGGAARCSEGRIRTSVEQARAVSDLVIFQIHGGYEYGRSPSPQVRRLSYTAREAGARLIVNHHPHVVGGFDWDGSSLVAWTLGNFIFDQTVWPTFESYLLAVHVRRGEVVRAYTEPLIIEGYLPRGVTGALADYVARGAAGREPGPFRVEDGAMEVDIAGHASTRDTVIPVHGNSERGTIFRLGPGWSITGAKEGLVVRLGRDLLWTGSFEDEVVGTEYRGRPPLWTFAGPGKEARPEYTFAGSAGVRLRRAARSEADVVFAPLHRILVDPRRELTVLGTFRASTEQTLTGAPATGSVQLSWYPDTRGPSVYQTIEPLNTGDDNDWQPFRIDETVPPYAIAVGLYLRLSPPARGQATADFDDVRLIEWAPEGARFSPLYTHFLVKGSGEVRLSRDVLPGESYPGPLPVRGSTKQR